MVTLRLNALVTHIGQSSIRGHYTCIAKHTHDNQWRLFNDDKVHIISESEVLSHMNTVYLLFYTFDI